MIICIVKDKMKEQQGKNKITLIDDFSYQPFVLADMGHTILPSVKRCQTMQSLLYIVFK